MRGVLAVEDWAEIRRLHRAEGLPIKAIVRRLGVSRNAVRRALASSSPPRYSRPARGSAVDSFEPAIRVLLAEFPDMPASVIAERVGWTRSASVLRARVARLRPLFVPPDPASRTAYGPGELAQCDLWFPPVDVPLGHGQVGRPPVLVIVAGYSRVISAVMLPSRQAPDLIAGHWLLLEHLGAVPRALVWDNESAVGSWRAGRPKLTAEFEAFRGMLGIRDRNRRHGRTDARPCRTRPAGPAQLHCGHPTESMTGAVSATCWPASTEATRRNGTLPSSPWPMRYGHSQGAAGRSIHATSGSSRARSMRHLRPALIAIVRPPR